MALPSAERTSCKLLTTPISQLLTFSLAYRSGVTTAVTAPMSASMISGLSYAYSLSAEHSLSSGAIVNPAAALHISLDNSKISISSKIAVLRKLLQSPSEEEETSEIVREIKSVKRGERRLVVEVNKADVIAAVIRLKREVAPGARITILGGTESWMVSCKAELLKSS